jgi:hypothetical protein
MTAQASYFPFQCIDICTGELFAPTKDQCQVEANQVPDVSICCFLRVNCFMLMVQLAQYWLMDFYLRVLDQRMSIIQKIKTRIMMGQTRQISDNLTKHEEQDRHAAGYIDEPKNESYLPSSVHGSPCHMTTLANNALVLVSEFGCLHVFITLTCNPKWPEIVSQLLDGQTASDRPDVTAAVYKSRLDQMKMDIRNGKYFDGHEPTYLFHVIEYQYPGLPHAHIVAQLDDANDIDDPNCEDLTNFINRHFAAEMPRFDGEEFQNIYAADGAPACTEYKQKAVEMVRMNNTHRCATAINGCKKDANNLCKCGYSRSKNDLRNLRKPGHKQDCILM